MLLTELLPVSSNRFPLKPTVNVAEAILIIASSSVSETFTLSPAFMAALSTLGVRLCANAPAAMPNTSAIASTTENSLFFTLCILLYQLALAGKLLIFPLQ